MQNSAKNKNQATQSGESSLRQSPNPSIGVVSTDSSREHTLRLCSDDSHETHSVHNCNSLPFPIILAISNEDNQEFSDETHYISVKKKKNEKLTDPLLNPIPGIAYFFVFLICNSELENLKASYKRANKEEIIVDATGVYCYEENPNEYMKARKYFFK